MSILKQKLFQNEKLAKYAEESLQKHDITELDYLKIKKAYLKNEKTNIIIFTNIKYS